MLAALGELFAAVSCSTLDIREDVSETSQSSQGRGVEARGGGVGRTFDKYPVVILRGENREIVRIRRVNGFHLSYAINYHLSAIAAVIQQSSKWRPNKL